MASSEIKVSVIVPFYGVSRYIEKCAVSLMEQTYPFIEFIFVDDGSKDGEAAILQNVLSKYPGRDVKILKKENGGLPQARLSGLREASGEYVLNVDSDDYVEADMVEKLARTASHTGADIVHCGWTVEGEGYSRKGLDRDYSSGKVFSRDILHFKAHGYVWNKLLRRSLLTEDIFYPRFGMHEDMVLLCQVLPKAGKIARVKDALYHYRKSSSGSISALMKEKRDGESARNFLELIDFWRGRENCPFRKDYPYLVSRIVWTAYKQDRSIAEEYPSLQDMAVKMKRCGSLKEDIRYRKARRWLLERPFFCDRVLCCIFNHNENEKASRWADILSGSFDTFILDSGSTPPCSHPCAVTLDNIFYSGLMNEAARRALEGGYPWTVVLTSDLGISEKDAIKLKRKIREISLTGNVGLYQPSNSLRGSSHWHSARHWPHIVRNVHFQEGWFHMVRTDILSRMCPVDVSVNLLGWGLDVALSNYCMMEKKLILVDSSVCVQHPRGTGYSKDKALEQMEAWLSLFPEFKDGKALRKNAAKLPVRYEN